MSILILNPGKGFICRRSQVWEISCGVLKRLLASNGSEPSARNSWRSPANALSSSTSASAVAPNDGQSIRAIEPGTKTDVGNIFSDSVASHRDVVRIPYRIISTVGKVVS